MKSGRDFAKLQNLNGLGQTVVQAAAQVFDGETICLQSKVGDLSDGVNSGVSSTAAGDSDCLITQVQDRGDESFLDRLLWIHMPALPALCLPPAKIRAIVGQPHRVFGFHGDDFCRAWRFETQGRHQPKLHGIPLPIKGESSKLTIPTSAMRFSIHTLQLRESFRIAHGSSATRQVLRLSEDGHTTEAPFVPYYGEIPEDTLESLNRAEWPDPLPHTARLALSLFDLEKECMASRKSLSDRAEAKLGKALHPSPPGCRSFGIPDDLERFEKEVRKVAKQFKVLKLKLGSGDLGLDLAIVSVARRAARDAQLLLDVNGGWEPSESPMMIQKLMDYRPAIIEQPFHHRHPVEAWRDLRAELPENAPLLFADESVQNADDIAGLAPYADGVNVKLLKCGGFDEAVIMIATARDHHLRVLLGCMIESSLGTTAAAHLAPWADWIDLDGHFYVANDDYAGIEYDAAGSLIMPGGPGIGAIPR